ncbi:hypothetical protein JZU46_04880 [bacterium]|jgi:hypothetical protein|nr:hypothetical protein [bacterium]
MEAVLIEPKNQEISPYAVPGVIVFDSIDLIQSIVCDLYHVKSLKGNAKIRLGELVEARQICMALYYHLFKVRGATLSDAAAPFGKDHATVIHAKKTIKNRLERQPKDRLAVNYTAAFYKFAEYGTVKNQLEHYDLL